MKILLDIGNSRLKWGVEMQQEVSFCGVIDYRQEAFADHMLKAWQTLNSPQILAISSVGSQQLLEQVVLLAQSTWPGVKVVIATSSAHAFGVTSGYRQPEKLGVDRWLNLLALHHNYPGIGCVIDCGTAITLDFLDAQGVHLGGLISPGLMLMKKSLMKGTTDLPLTGSEQRVELADDTETAIYSGTLYSAIGLIEHVLARREYPEQVVVTGGDAPLVARNLAVKTVVEPDFVLKGLALYCSEYQA